MRRQTIVKPEYKDKYNFNLHSNMTIMEFELLLGELKNTDETTTISFLGEPNPVIRVDTENNVIQIDSVRFFETEYPDEFDEEG